MKKIFTIFAALACMMSMSAATLYLRGDFNGWGTSNALDANGKCEIELKVGNYGFKIADATWGAANYGSDATISATTNGVQFVLGSGNCKLKATTEGTYTFTFNANTLTLDVTYPAGEVVEIAPTVVLAGDFNDWNTTANALTNDAENLMATTTINFEVGTYEFKVVEDGAWLGDNNQIITRANNSQVFETVDGSTNCSLTADVAGEYTFTWVYKTNTLTVTYPEAGENPGEEPGDDPVDPNPGDDPVVDPETGVTYNVTVPAGTKACYIAGEMNSWSFTEMTKIDDTHYTVTLAEATEAMGYKYCSGPGWAYVEVTEEDGEVANRTYAANDVVVKWASVYDPANAPTPGEAKDITIKAKVPATWTNTITAWVWATGEPGKELIPTKEGDWYVYTEHCSELNIIFKNGEGWNGDVNQTVDITVSESTCIEITAGASKATYTLVDCEENPGEEPGDDPIVTPTDAAYVLMGVGGDWETGIAFTRNEANTLEEEYMLLGQVISEGDSVKVVGIVDGVATYYNTVDEASVSHTLSEDYQNIVLAPGTYDFYFKVASQVIYIGASLPSAVDNVTVEGKAVKVIRNGQMYILRDGVMYNAIGQIAE